MSQLHLENRNIKRKEIEMPPLPVEEVVQAISDSSQQEAAPEVNSQQEVQEPEEVQQDVHAKEEVLQAQRDEPAPLPAVKERESAQAKNFRELRDKAERFAKERDDLAQKLKDYELTRSAKEDYDIAPDDLVEGKHLAKFIKTQKELETKLKQYEQQRYMQDAETRLRAKFTDFDSVVNADTINALKEKDPQAVAALQASSHDPEGALSLAYMAIKFNGLAKNPQESADALRAQKNSVKPRPLNSVAASHSDSPISRMNAFAEGSVSKEVSAQLWKEMQAAMKGR